MYDNILFHEIYAVKVVLLSNSKPRYRSCWNFNSFYPAAPLAMFFNWAVERLWTTFTGSSSVLQFTASKDLVSFVILLTNVIINFNIILILIFKL